MVSGIDLQQLLNFAVGGVVAGLFTTLFAPYVSHSLQLHRMRLEYATYHIEKTFVPILTEISDIDDRVNRGVIAQLKVQGYRPSIGSDLRFRDAKSQGSYEIMKLHDRKLTERIERFYEEVWPVLRKVEEAFDDAKRQIVSSWEQELKDRHVPELATLLTYLHDNTGLIKNIYANDMKGVDAIPSGHTALKPLDGADIRKLIEIAQTFVPQVEAAIKQAQEDFRRHGVGELLADIRKKIGRPI